MIGPGLIVAVTLSWSHPGSESVIDPTVAGAAGIVRRSGEADMAGGTGDARSVSTLAAIPESPHRPRPAAGPPAGFSALLAAHAAGLASLPVAPGVDGVGREEGRAAASEIPARASEEDGDEVVEAVPFLPADTVTLDPAMLKGLSGEFTARLKRVVDRMWNEHGLHVEIVEGYRSQSRQEGLFTQGRTAPGPVVTWTRSSLHTRGMAADLQIAGAPVEPSDAVVLARIAREEGLATLYPLDSGHIQMDVAGADVGPEGPLRREPVPQLSPATRSRPRGVAPVAPVAPVARPATGGGVAEATVTPSPDDRGDRHPVPTSYQDGAVTVASASRPVPRPVPGAAATPVPDDPSSVARGGAAHPTPPSSGPAVEGGADAPKPRGAEATSREGADHSTLRTAARGQPETGPMLAPPTGVSPPTTAPPAPVEGRGSAAPVALDPGIHEPTEAALYYRRLHVPIEGLDGSASLHVGLRGETVDARLIVSDPLLASELRGRLHELKSQLDARGVETGDLAVRLVPAVRSDAVGAAPASSAASTGSGRHTDSASDEPAEQDRGGRPRQPDEDGGHGGRSRRDRNRERTSQ